MPITPGVYEPRYGDSIASLLARQGEIAARGAENSGMLWANAINQIGGLAAGAVQQHQEQKAQQKRDAALMDFVNSGVWAKDPQAALKGSVAILGPAGVKFAEGLISTARMSEVQNDPEAAMKLLPGMAGGILAAPPTTRPMLWGGVVSTLEKAGVVKPGALSPEWNEAEHLPLVQAYAPKGKPAEPKVVAGRLISPEGKVVYEPPPEPKEVKPPATQNIGGRVMQFNPESGRYDIPLGASEAALNREAAAVTRAAVQAEKETEKQEKKTEAQQKAARAVRETDSQVDAAFGAMESALKEVEKYSGSAAATSPLEAANARQQYDAAAKAFAATLSRATGDTRISDLDRKAYAGLLSYESLGSTALKVLKPQLVRKRLENAKTFFDAAKKEREKARAAGAEDVSGGAVSGSGTADDPFRF